MSNYYVSNCCGAEVEYLDIENENGICSKCHEGCGIEVIIDEE